MLTEHKLLVHSLRPDLLTSVCEALVSVSATLPGPPSPEPLFFQVPAFLDLSPYFSFLEEGSQSLSLRTDFRNKQAPFPQYQCPLSLLCPSVLPQTPLTCSLSLGFR